MSYAELEESSNRFARQLATQIEGSDNKMVAVCRERDLVFYVAQVGIWKAGGCYVSVILIL
jgi:non-ribosomal peptide synthetase component F